MNQLQVILDDQQVAKENAKQLLDAFGAPFEEAGAILASYQLIKVANEDDLTTMAEARDKRLALKKVRTGVENKRKELKSDIVKAGKAIDSVAKYVKDTIEPAEAYLETQEKFAEIKAAERASKKRADRIEQLSKLTDDISLYNFEAMTDDQFNKLLADLKAQQLAKLEADKKAEEDRLASIVAERKRRAEIEAENARLKKEADERAAEIEAERKVAAKAQAKLQAEHDKKLAYERAQAQAELKRLADEAEKKLSAERAVANAERQKREALEAGQRAQVELEARKKSEAEESDRKALLAPDKEKIVAFANALNALRTESPTVRTKEAQVLLAQVDGVIAGLSEKILAKARSL